MIIHAVDPGPVKSAIVTIGDDFVRAQTGDNVDVLGVIEAAATVGDVLVIEQIASYGMPVGAEIFETVFWSGRFAQRWETVSRSKAHRIPRLAVKVAICHDSRAKDANIRAALIDRFGGPACIRKGGPLYKVKGDEWSALAVAVTYQERIQQT